MGFRKALSMQNYMSRHTLNFQGNLNIKADSNQFFLIEVTHETLCLALFWHVQYWIYIAHVNK